MENDDFIVIEGIHKNPNNIDTIDEKTKKIHGPFKKKQKIFNKKIVTLVWEFEKFYPAESYHQDYYEKNFIRYLLYKKGCQREETLKKIWN